VSDDPRQTRAQAIEAAIRHMRDMWGEAGFDPADRDDQRRYGEIMRGTEELLELREKRRDALAKIIGAVLTAAAIGALTTGGPWLMRLWLKQ
jgi:hypothetical protein